MDGARAALAAAITLARTSAYMPGEYFTEICREQTHPHFESEEEANAPQDTHHHPFISHKGKTIPLPFQVRAGMSDRTSIPIVKHTVSLAQVH